MSGSQIGGVVGAAVGAVVGLYTGDWQAVQWGYAIGSAVGGYVDPTKTSGPRLTDAQSQTSSVGGIIPFGYGTYTCAGNIIWTDKLIEHKKTERVGKGGSQKNTTYTYTRSYAIGVSETISAYVWIKKNGKLVYAADPVSLGTAMDWTSKQISDLATASNKFLQMATLYYGTASQMPDSTIVAIEGVGNVSPFRDLAYIVLENEDLTDTQGAVSQYEFCVFRGAAKSYTTPPYPVYSTDSLVVHSIPTGGAQPTWPKDYMDLRLSLIGGQLRNVVVPYSTSGDKLDLSTLPLGGELKNVKVYYNNYPWEAINILQVQPLGGQLKTVVLYYQNYQPESLNLSIAALGGALS